MVVDDDNDVSMLLSLAHLLSVVFCDSASNAELCFTPLSLLSYNHENCIRVVFILLVLVKNEEW